jgi:predicted N-formylglutamate amidohydrolase
MTQTQPARDPPPVEVINPQATRPLLIIADHAGRSVPHGWADEVGPLGLPTEAFDLHIAWDIGAAGVARRLAAHLNVTAVLATYTRLLIDLNRPLGDPDCIPPNSDGTPIPANQHLPPGDMERRAAAFYWPYHSAVDLALARLKLGGAVPLLLSVHSFTPALRVGGPSRPWHAGVMASRDRRLADALVTALASRGHAVALNEPYSGITHGYCLKVHGLAQGLPHAQLEIRQDLIGTEAGQAAWADLLAPILESQMADATMQTIEHH